MINSKERQVIRTSKLFQPINNMVLVKVDFDPSEEQKRDSGIIIANTGWHEEQFVSRYGTVSRVPSALRIKTKKTEGLHWSTELEIQEGDTVYWGKMAGANCPVIISGDDVYFLLEYSELIVRKRGDELYPLNGYLLMEEVTEKMRRDGLILDFGDFKNERLGIVRYVGKPNAFYYGSDAQDAFVEVGDKVAFEYSMFTMLENKLFATTDMLGYIQACWVIAKI